MIVLLLKAHTYQLFRANKAIRKKALILTKILKIGLLNYTF